MSIFGFIKDKIFGHAEAPAAAPAAAPTVVAAAAPAPVVPSAPVDVEAVLAQMAATDGVQSNWQSSVVDLMKLLNMDSSLDARKTLATELGVNAGAPGTAEQNIALYKAVMARLEDDGATVSPTLKG